MPHAGNSKSKQQCELFQFLNLVSTPPKVSGAKMKLHFPSKKCCERSSSAPALRVSDRQKKSTAAEDVSKHEGIGSNEKEIVARKAFRAIATVLMVRMLS